MLKKIIPVILVLGLIISLSACSTAEPSSWKPVDNNIPTDPPPTVAPTYAPKAHGTVRVATTAISVRNETLDKNRKGWISVIDKAAVVGPDVIVLSEGVYTRGTGTATTSLGEAIDGDLFRSMSEKAKEYKVYLVYSFFERVVGTPKDDGLYNVAILLDRDGKIAGRYVKYKLPADEINMGATSGESMYKAGKKTLLESFPVFQTDFGIVGLEVCYDMEYKEPTKELAKNGAQIIFAPSIGYFGKNYNYLAKENNVFLVVSGQDSYAYTTGFDGTVQNADNKDDISFIIGKSGEKLAGCRDITTDAASFEPWYNFDAKTCGSFTYTDIKLN